MHDRHGIVIDGIHHATVLVADLERALGFYRDVLGLVPSPARPDLGFPGAWLDIGSQQIHLMELPNPDPVEGRPSHGGRDRHTALVVNDVEALARALEAGGVDHSRSRSGRAALFCRDPDGNALEFVGRGA